MEFAHTGHLIREAVHRRLDRTYEVAVGLRVTRVILHSGYTVEHDLFNLQDVWLGGNIEFRQGEIRRWADAGIGIVLENDVDHLPDLMVQVVDGVGNPFLGLCMDIGHQHVFSGLDAPEWVRRMRDRLYHVHLHDNDGACDHHWRLGRGTIDFEPFYTALSEHAPQATLALEVEGRMEGKMGDLRRLAARFIGR